MTDRYVLDTDTLIDVLRGRRDVIDRMAALSPEDMRVSAISVSELYYGVLRSRDPARNGAEVERLLEHIAVLPFGRAAARRHGAIRLATDHQRIGTGDLMIAATALVSDAIVVTSNRREFQRVPGLRLTSWRNE